MAPYIKAVAIRAIRAYLSATPANGGPSLQMEMNIMENVVRSEIVRLEEELQHLRAMLPKELDLLHEMTSRSPARQTFARYDEFAKEGTKECEEKCANISREINKLKSALDDYVDAFGESNSAFGMPSR